MTEIKVEPRPPIPAIMHLRAKYGRHYGCLRRQIVSKKAKLKASLAGKPNKKFSQHELTKLDMVEAEYNVSRRNQQAERPYKGSEDEMEHKLGMRLPRR